MISKQQFWDIANVTQHSEFEAYLSKIIFDKPKRESFFKKILAIDPQCVKQDTFKQYFEDYSAERKANKQDYTPDEVSRLLAILTNQHNDGDKLRVLKDGSIPAGQGSYTASDFAAGTGSLLIQKWWFDMTQEMPWTYVPHRYFYFAQELADNAIPYLLLNLALRGMNCMVVHGDTLEGTTKQIYFVENADDDYLHFSDINVMPHSDDVAKEFNVTKWLEEPIDHIETDLDIHWDMSYFPSLAKNKPDSTPDPNAKPKPFIPANQRQLQLKDIADIERVKAKKEYPRGTVVIQISATRGQCGWLKSSGSVGTKYAAVQFKPYVPSYLIWQEIKTRIPRWLKKYQEGPNVKLEDVGKIPIYLPVQWLLPFDQQGTQTEQMSLF